MTSDKIKALEAEAKALLAKIKAAKAEEARERNSTFYSEEDKNLIRALHARKVPISKMLPLFPGRKEGALKNLLHRLGLSIADLPRNGRAYKGRHNYTADQDALLQEMANQCKHSEEITRAFNERFGLDLDHSRIRCRIWTLLGGAEGFKLYRDCVKAETGR